MTVQTPIENRMEAFRQRWQGKVGRMLIGGEWREAASGETFATEDPSTGEKLADVASAGQADVDAAVAAARAAFEGPWSKVKPDERARLINRLADLIEARGEELALTETLDVGRPIQFSRMIDVGGAVGDGPALGKAVGRQELALDAIADAGVDLLLAGHNHRASSHSARELATRAGAALVIQAGTATSVRLRDEEQSFNRIDVAGGRVTLTVQSWNGHGFVSGDEQTYAREGDHWRLAKRAVVPERTA